MTQAALHPEHHRIKNTGWLRTAVLGANDGIVSTGSLIIGSPPLDRSGSRESTGTS